MIGENRTPAVKRRGSQGTGVAADDGNRTIPDLDRTHTAVAAGAS